MRNRFCLLLVAVLLFSSQGFGNTFPMVLKDIRSKQISGVQETFIKHYKNKKELFQGLRISKRMKGSGKQRDPFSRRRLRRPVDGELSRKKVKGANYIISFTIAKKVIFRPKERE